MFYKNLQVLVSNERNSSSSSNNNNDSSENTVPLTDNMVKSQIEVNYI